MFNLLVTRKIFMLYSFFKKFENHLIMQVKQSLRSSLRLFLFITSIIIIFFYIRNCMLLSNFPIYPDEITIRSWLSRSVFDFPWHINVIPSSDNFKSRLPLIWYFSSFVEWCVHGCINSLYSLRLVGVASYVTMAILLTFLLLNKTQKNIFNLITGLAIVLSCISIGVLPVFLIMNRPEQNILIGLIILLLVYYHNYRKDYDKKSIILSLICFYFCVSLMLYMHAKSLYLTPAYFLITYTITSRLKTRRYTYFNFLLLSLLIISNLLAWQAELLYAHLPSVKTYMDSFNIHLSELFLNTQNFLGQLNQSLIDDKSLLLSKLIFQNVTDINYMPSLSTNVDIINKMLEINVMLLSLYLLIALVIGYGKDIYNKNYLSPRLLLLFIMLSIIGGNLLNITKTWYDVGYFWAIVMIIFIAHLQESVAKKLNQIITICIFCYLIMIAIFSLIVFQQNYKKPLLTDFAGPGVNLSHFNYQNYQQEMKKVTQHCLGNNKSPHGLVLDDYTYLYFKKFKFPILITFINNHTDSNQFPKFINANQLGAIIIRCTYLPIVPNFQEKNVIRLGDICCISNDKLQTL